MTTRRQLRALLSEVAERRAAVNGLDSGVTRALLHMEDVVLGLDDVATAVEQLRAQPKVGQNKRGTPRRKAIVTPG